LLAVGLALGTAGGLAAACSAGDGGGGDDDIGQAGGTGDDEGSGGAPATGGGQGTLEPGGTGGPGGATGEEREAFVVTDPELWYSSAENLVYVELEPADGTVKTLVSSTVTGLPVGQNSLTMMPNGALVGARLAGSATTLYLIEQPPRAATTLEPTPLGTMSDSLLLEALYTDCDGRLYGMDTGMDTGTDIGNSTGNRLIRFTGEFLEGDFAYEVITDLGSASVADIDDLGPGIGEDGSQNIDNPGFAIDTGAIYDFNYTEGTGTEVGRGGSWGIHALGGKLFGDGLARVYLLDQEARLFSWEPAADLLSAMLVQGPTVTSGYRGHSGITGPLTDCVSAFPPMIVR
jgi:hypothetical protein